jgi:hypothetical protein
MLYGDEPSLARVLELMPKVFKKTRKLNDGSCEEYFDYFFNDGDDKCSQKVIDLPKKIQEWRTRIQLHGSNP